VKRHETLITRRLAIGGGAAWAAPLIAVAASLKPPIEEIAGAAGALRLVFGATAAFVRQIEQGAPFEAFLSADEAAPKRLADAGRTIGPPRVFALGRLSLAVGRASGLPLESGLAGLRAALDDGRIKRFAIANPELAPYGRAALEALEAAGLPAAVAPRLILAENVMQAATLIAGGGAQAGLVATSALSVPGLAAHLRAVPVDAALHAPIRHAMVALTGAGPAALGFLAGLAAPASAPYLTRHGFAAP
jgi:molybdate transport system substrate-binding protein